MGAQRSYLKIQSEQAHKRDTYAEDLPKAEASKRINQLRNRSIWNEATSRCQPSVQKLYHHSIRLLSVSPI
ncbi:DUF3072 domain-containing protein (plasmid) [Agrobacterium vaccinii]|nr:DUF3072 domain-containing protein [Agrobacterium vaccinii]